MCTPDTPPPAVPALDAGDFLLILQSLLHHRQGKHRAYHPSWLAAADFAQHTWQEYGQNHGQDPADNTAYAAFCTMFGISPPTPPPHATFGQTADAAYACWAAGERTVTFFTSGSTGMPKPCPHSEGMLLQEVADVLPLLTPLPPRQWALVAVPLHHLYGFTFGLLLPKALGIPLRVEAPLPTAIAQQMLPGDVVVGIPLLWTGLATLRRVPRHDALLLSATAPLPDASLNALRDHGFSCLEIFGASETGALGYRQRGHSPFTLFPRFSRVTNANGCTLRRTLPNGDTCLLPLQDTHHWLDERHFVPQGRKDHAVQVGGINVYPEQVAKMLAEHPGVRECVVRLMRPEEGKRLKAFVVPTTLATRQLVQELRALARERLRVEERPAAYTLGAVLPRNDMGKLTDWHAGKRDSSTFSVE